MVFKKNFVAVVKCRGKILRENNDVVNITFGEEYSILLKNLESRKALVSITIDGKDILDGNSLILPANSDFELQGFLSRNQVKNKFKFIQKTDEIVEHRGDRVDDGMIRIEYRYEQKVTTEIVNKICNRASCHNCIVFSCPKRCGSSYWYSNIGGSGMTTNAIGTSTGGPETIRSVSKGISEPIMGSVNDMNHTYNVQQDVSNMMRGQTFNFVQQDEGITVKGSQSNQSFTYGNVGVLEDTSNVIIIRLKGTNSKGEVVEQPLLVDTKIQCETCGRMSKSGDKFCPNCGSSLI